MERYEPQGGPETPSYSQMGEGDSEGEQRLP